MNKRLFFLFLWLPSCLWAQHIETFYGLIDVEEPILLELIDSPAVQRLKKIHQYGIAYYTTHPEEYNRYDHSLGVFAILRAKGLSLQEQIAGLLHDVSHTVFSHVGDWMFSREYQDKDYQNTIHATFLEESGLGEILRRYGFSIEEVLVDEQLFPALENSLPNLCADRIDYNIQGAYYQGFITYEEAMAIFTEIQFRENRWVSCCPELMKKLTQFSLFMTEQCWGSPINYLLSRWLAEAILRGVDLGSISYADIHFGTDELIWNELMKSQDEIIIKKMQMILNYDKCIGFSERSNEADFLIKSKFRGVDPWILTDSNCLRLTHLFSDLYEEYERVRKRIETGWMVTVGTKTMQSIKNW